MLISSAASTLLPLLLPLLPPTPRLYLANSVFVLLLMVSLAFLCNRCKCHLTISAALVGALVGVCLCVCECVCVYLFVCFVCLNLYFSAAVAVATAPVLLA